MWFWFTIFPTLFFRLVLALDFFLLLASLLMGRSSMFLSLSGSSRSWIFPSLAFLHIIVLFFLALLYSLITYVLSSTSSISIFLFLMDSMWRLRMFFGDFSGKFRLVSMEFFSLSFFLDFLFIVQGRFSLFSMIYFDLLLTSTCDFPAKMGCRGIISTSFSKGLYSLFYMRELGSFSTDIGQFQMDISGLLACSDWAYSLTRSYKCLQASAFSSYVMGITQFLRFGCRLPSFMIPPRTSKASLPSLTHPSMQVYSFLLYLTFYPLLMLANSHGFSCRFIQTHNLYNCFSMSMKSQLDIPSLISFKRSPQRDPYRSMYSYLHSSFMGRMVSQFYCNILRRLSFILCSRSAPYVFRWEILRVLQIQSISTLISCCMPVQVLMKVSCVHLEKRKGLSMAHPSEPGKVVVMSSSKCVLNSEAIMKVEVVLAILGASWLILSCRLLMSFWLLIYSHLYLVICSERLLMIRYFQSMICCTSWLKGRGQFGC